MKSSYRILAMPEPCAYLPGQMTRMEYEFVLRMTPAEYAERLLAGWRRFGCTLFRPRCRSCVACQSLRVDAVRFTPDRSQRRVLKANEGAVSLEIAEPEDPYTCSPLSAMILDLWQRFHDARSDTLGWASQSITGDGFRESFVRNPIPSEEWRYWLHGKLVGVGYVDALPIGLSGIYFAHEPSLSRRSLGTWNVLSLIAEARSRTLPHVYLGYHVADCRSLAYKARFRPHEILGPDGRWREVPDG